MAELSGDRTQARHRFESYEQTVTDVIRGYLDSCLSPALDWERLGYHRAVLALRHGLVPDSHSEHVLDAIAGHQRSCFPNDLAAPRNSAPFLREPRLITPYFYHYAMPLFAAADRLQYVLDQYHSCWGWLLEGGHTTWCEVFDRRWSRCHHWSGSPTWQLSRYVLGIAPSRLHGHNTWRFTGRRHNLTAEGIIPIASGSDPDAACALTVRTRREGDRMRVEIDCPTPLRIIGREHGEEIGTRPGGTRAPVESAVELPPGGGVVAGDLRTGAVETVG